MPTQEWYCQHRDDPEFKAKRKEEGRRYWEKNKERQNARRRKRRMEDEEFRLRQNELVRESSERAMADPEKRAERNRKQCEWYKNSSEEAKAKRREYMEHYVEPDSTKKKRKAWVIKRRADHMERLVELLGGECRACGLIDNPIVYDFHHIDPALKQFNISTGIASISWDKIWEEAQKCVLLCSICHRKLHFGLIQSDEIKQPDWDEFGEAKSTDTD